MDFEKFRTWKRNAAIVSMSKAPCRVIPLGVEAPDDGEPYETCAGVFDKLVDDGIAFVLPDGKYTLVNPESEAALFGVKHAAKQSRKLLQELLIENDKLVRKLVNKLFTRSTAHAEEEDLYQAGLMAFCKTVEKFDPDRYSTKGTGASFSTFLNHWIRHYTQQSTISQQPIKCPRGFGMPFDVFTAATEIEGRTGRPATAEELGVTPEQLFDWRKVAPSFMSMNSSDMDAGHDRAFPGVSMEALLDTDNNPEEAYMRAERNELLEKAMASLPARDRQVIIDFNNGVSYKTMAAELGMSDESVRLIRVGAIATLRQLMSDCS